jgi:hypothetical protein
MLQVSTLLKGEKCGTYVIWFLTFCFQGLGKENMFSNSDEFNFRNTDLKDGLPVSAEDFSFSWLSDNSYQSSAPDHGKRSFSDVKPCQIACKRPRQIEENPWLNSHEEHPFSVAAETSASGFILCLPITIIYVINNMNCSRIFLWVIVIVGFQP